MTSPSSSRCYLATCFGIQF